MRIGLVGEAPNDTEAIKNLLNKKYSALEFFFMLNNINGSNLDNQKTKRLLRIEYEFEKPDIVIFIRDLDSVLPNKKKLYERKNYFTEFNSVVSHSLTSRHFQFFVKNIPIKEQADKV